MPQTQERGQDIGTPATPVEARQPGDGPAWPHHGLLVLFTFIWGANFVLAEVALRQMRPMSFSVSRFVVGGAAMLAVLSLQSLWTARRDGSRMTLFPSMRRRDWPRLLVVAVLGALLAPWLGIEGLGLTHGARASLWLALGPVLSSGIGVALRTERLRVIGYVGVALAAVGTFFLAVDGLRPERDYWLGDLLLFLALLAAVGELHVIKPLARRYGATPMVAARTAIGGGLYLLVAAPGLVDEPWLRLDAWTWIAILAGGAVGVGIGQWVKVRALHVLGPTGVVLYGNLVPLAALVIAWVALSQRPSVLEMVAAFFIIVGAVFVQAFDKYAHAAVPASPS